MTSTHSTPDPAKGQLTAFRRVLLLAGLGILIGLAGGSGTGCCNLFRETRILYPSDTCARLQRRIDEARQAEQRTWQVALRVREHLGDAGDRERIGPDIDLLEVAAWDFRRRVNAAQDAAGECPEPNRDQAELDRLAHLSQKRLEVLEAIRAADPALQRLLLDELVSCPPAR
jgi:hypothetical protein